MLSIFYDLLYSSRLWLMPSQRRYTVPAIQKMHKVRIKKGNASNQKLLSIAVFLGDVLFCIVSAITLILLRYWLNNGAFRAGAPLLMILGFFLWRVSLSEGFRIALQWSVFGTETVVRVLFMPFKRLFTCVLEKVKAHLKARHKKHCEKQRRSYTKNEFQNIAKTAERLLPLPPKNRMQKGDDHAKHRKKAI